MEEKESIIENKNFSMKTILIAILIMASAVNTIAQYNSLDAATVKKMKLAKITEWTISTDSLSNTTDSSCVRIIYNRSGKLIEKDYDFNKSQSIFISVQYSYNDKGFMIDSTENVPYLTISQPEVDTFASTEIIYGKYPVEKTIINKKDDGEQDVWTYIYNKYLDLGELLATIFIQTNIKQGKFVRFEYTFFGD
jgi:hypothetical protein